MSVEVIIEDSRWDGSGIAAIADEAAAAALRHLGLDPAGWEIAILACDDARIAALNGSFRDRPAPTNVLSWPSADRAPARPGQHPAAPDPAEPELGDIALAWETCAREASEAARPLAHHLRHLVVHAVLHLLGHDHEDDADALLMERTEIAILATLGVPDPYLPAGAQDAPGKDR